MAACEMIQKIRLFYIPKEEVSERVVRHLRENKLILHKVEFIDVNPYLDEGRHEELRRQWQVSAVPHLIVSYLHGLPIQRYEGDAAAGWAYKLAESARDSLFLSTEGNNGGSNISGNGSGHELINAKLDALITLCTQIQAALTRGAGGSGTVPPLGGLKPFSLTPGESSLPDLALLGDGGGGAAVGRQSSRPSIDSIMEARKALKVKPM